MSTCAAKFLFFLVLQTMTSGHNQGPNDACSLRCYRGTCRTTSGCVCPSGFSGESCLTITTKPRILQNQLILKADKNTEAPGDIHSGPPQNVTWSNIASPSGVGFSFTAKHISDKKEDKKEEKKEDSVVNPSEGIRTRRQATPGSIGGYKVGIVDASAKFTLRRQTTAQRIKVFTREFKCDCVLPTCTNLATCRNDPATSKLASNVQCHRPSNDNPDVDGYTCAGKKTGDEVFPSLLPFRHRDDIVFSYTAINGGYVRNQGSDTQATYNGATQTHTFTVSIDLVAPYHARRSTRRSTPACVGSMLAAPNIIRTPIVNLRWSCWSDADSGIDRFVRGVTELQNVEGVLRERSDGFDHMDFNSSTDSYRISSLLDGIYTTLVATSMGLGAAGVGLLSTIVAAPVVLGLEMAAGVSGLVGIALNFISRWLQRKALKHDEIRVLAEAKLNTIDDYVSKAFTDSKISKEEFRLVLAELTKYHRMKQEIPTKTR